MSEPTKYSARIYGDMGDYVEVGPDPDGLDLIEISYTDGDETRVLCVDGEMAEKLANAIMTVKGLNSQEDTEG